MDTTRGVGLVGANWISKRDPDEMSGSPEVGLDSLFRRDYAALVRLAYLLTGSNAIAEEVVQDSFETLQRRWRTVRDPEAYVRRIVVNRCRGHHRRAAVERKHAPNPAPPTLPPEIDEMWSLIQQLSPKGRAVVVLRFYDDLSIDAIADVLELRAGTVKSLLHRSLKKLQEQLS
jgi:DNA-directed RNA polymerase specialized sigma24 family protein